MSVEAEFLVALAQALSAMSLYAEGHVARARSTEQAYEKLVDLLARSPRSEFTFIEGDVVANQRPLRELKSWDWGDRLEDAGIQRLEFEAPVTREDFEGFLDDALRRLLGGLPSAEARPGRETRVRWGSVGLKDEDRRIVRRREAASAILTFTLREEVEAVDYLHRELRERDELHLAEAEAVVRSLTVAMRGDRQFVIPLLRLKEFDQYTTTHALNVSVLAMALAEFMGVEGQQVRRFGIAGLLHDLGKVRVPATILNKPGKLTPEERDVMNSHPVEGARILLEEHDLDLPAVVAYEHHIRIDGGGYPALAVPRTCHPASDLVHVCDVFDALRTDRPYRDAWELDRVLDYIQERAGSEFDREYALGFVIMMRGWDARIAELPHPDDPVLVGEGAPVEPPESEGPAQPGP